MDQEAPNRRSAVKLVFLKKQGNLTEGYGVTVDNNRHVSSGEGAAVQSNFIQRRDSVHIFPQMLCTVPCTSDPSSEML